MDIASNLGMWGIAGIGALFGAGLVFVTLVPKAFSLGRREGYVQGRSSGEAAPHPPVTLVGGPADGLHVITPAPLCSKVGLRIDISLVDETYVTKHYTYTIVRPHVAEHTPEEGDDE